MTRNKQRYETHTDLWFHLVFTIIYQIFGNMIVYDREEVGFSVRK